METHGEQATEAEEIVTKSGPVELPYRYVFGAALNELQSNGMDDEAKMYECIAGTA
ncbi:hypothetical protein [Sedimentitalea nanhaiensis]|uniref:Uncharacterized protein n=1 Tax=Sedimentitalea nanhaiensis TaxID=999627 RepID=A0A1I7DMW0_9RHOB|nr:hypothetical protein [Sedimentitalea nanhaiensis]SFU12987.1 hypothetical protein SAMN05216236_1314 [Sedimentitalea nanhaiensis]